MRSSPRLLVALLSLTALGCDGRAQAEDSDTPQGAPLVAATAGVVDSAIPQAEALRRFRADLKDHPAALTSAAGSRDALARRFVRALETRDTSALRAMVLSRAEFAYVYYPSSKFSRPPYELPPGTLWLLMQENSSKGLRRALDRFAGKSLNYVDCRCQPEPERWGENALWNGCTIRRTVAPGDTVSERLFGTIIERGGRYKFVSYANEL